MRDFHGIFNAEGAEVFAKGRREEPTLFIFIKLAVRDRAQLFADQFKSEALPQ